ncbi:MAG: DNA-3-methyladenine glycosylase [Burkholderiales bacterium]|nr:DNA-3-methyladenine glycosylase [Burkholderiales bacterium]
MNQRRTDGYVPGASAAGEEDPGASVAPFSPLPPIDFSASSVEVARALIGATLLVDGVGGVVVETEAYDGEDPASHSFSGPTARNASMFGPPGRAYVYQSYGIHWCLNLVCQEEGHGAGVLIRALEPTAGLDLMRARRGLQNVQLLCAGPGRVAQALGITRAHDGLSVGEPPFQLLPPAGPVALVTGPRIGISKAIEKPWRFGLAGSRFVSQPFRQSGVGP